MKRLRWALAAILLGSPLALGLIYTLRVQGEYEHELELARSEGALITLEELTPKPIPLSENAATDYQDAISLYRAVPAKSRDLVSAFREGVSSWEDWLKRNGYGPGSGSKALDAACLDFKPAFDKLNQAVKKPKLSFRRNWAIPGSGFGEFGQLIGIANALIVDAKRPGRLSDVDGALDNLRTLRRVAHHIYQEPGLEALGMAEGLEARAVSAALRLAWMHRDSAINVSRVRDFILEPQEPFVFRDRIPASILEFNLMMDLLQSNPASLGLTPSDMSRLGMLKYKLTQVRQKKKAEALSYGRKLYALLPGTGRDFEAILARMRQGNMDVPWSEMNDEVTDDWSLDLSYDVLAGAHCQARFRQAILCTHLIDAYRENKRFPPQLPSLGEFSRDPHTGKQMKYVTNGKECIVYSLGPNLVDDVAAMPKIPWEGTNGDIGTGLPIDPPPKRKPKH